MEYFLAAMAKARDLVRVLFDKRVFALSVRNFTRRYSNAEVDMRFSLKGDLIPIPEQA